MSDIFNRIEELRKKRSLTRIALCRDIGINESMIRQWRDRPNSTPNADALNKLSKYFNVSVNYLLTGIEEEIPALTEKETKLIDNYRILDERDKTTVEDMAELLASKYCSKEEQSLSSG